MVRNRKAYSYRKSCITIYVIEGVQQSSFGEKPLCKVCCAPNDLIQAAVRARLRMLIRREKRSASIMLITVAAFIACMMPCGLAYSVSISANSVQLELEH